MQPTGYKPAPLRFTDYSYHKIYGAAPVNVQIKPLGRDITGVPIIFQGSKNTCVASTVAWITQYLNKAPSLSQDFLAVESNTAIDGATPSQVLDAAHKVGTCESAKWLECNEKITHELELNAAQNRIAGYAFLHDLSPAAIFDALKSNPVMIGVDSYRGSDPHMVAAFDVSDDSKSWKSANWWKSTEQDVIYIPFADVRFAAVILTEKPVGNVTVPITKVLASKWSFVPLVQKMIASLGVLLLVIIGAASAHLGQFLPNTTITIPAPQTSVTYTPPVQTPVVQESTPTPTPDKTYGASGIYDVYHATISGAGMASTDLTVPVSTLTLYTNETITSASTTFPVYLIINPNSATTREKVECNGLNAGTLTWTSCYRGLSAICNNSTSTVSGAAFPHASGEPVIMSNDSCYFNRYVDINTVQSVTGTKTFTGAGGQIKVGDSTTTTSKFVYFPDGQTNSPYFKVTGPTTGNSTSSFYFSPDGLSDLQLNASGTILTASSTAGTTIQSGQLAVVASSTASNNGGLLAFNNLGALYFDALGFLGHAWTVVGNWIYSGTVTFNGNVTSTSSFQAATPTSTADVSTKGYTDSDVMYGYATGTAGMAITPGAALYISTTGTIFMTDTSAVSSTFPFVGLSKGTYANSATVTFSPPGSINCNQSGLSGGYNYYLNGTAGAIAPTAVTNFARIGLAISASCVSVVRPAFIAKGTTTFTSGGATSAFVSTGFYPASISVVASQDGGAGGSNCTIGGTCGASWGDDTNNAVFASSTNNGTIGSFKSTSTAAWFISGAQSTTQGSGKIGSKTQTGFTFNVFQLPAAGDVTTLQWVARSE